MTKQEIRKTYAQKRAEINPKKKLDYDDLMLLKFQKYNYNFCSYLLTYWGITAKKEPNTHLYSSYLRHFVPNLQMAYPTTNFENATMQAIQIDENTVYKTNKYLITEPQSGNILPPSLFDIVFVPLFVCDKNGFRVGYGKGFYDKYLANCREDCVKIGFSYFEPIHKIDDINAFDIPLNMCITPTSVYEF
jgi:5-formyltetrahydrofolate cyclo-ligase